MKGRKATDLLGKRFYKLLVLERANSYYIHPTRQYKEAMWKCQCDCGETRIIRSSRITSGQAKSCGCLKRDLMATIGPRLGQFKKKPGTAQRGTFLAYRIRARRKGIPFELTFDEFMSLSQKPCAYCGRSKVNNETTPSGETFLYNGADRVDSSKGYLLFNCVPCCGPCNIAKFDLPAEEFIENCRRVTQFQNMKLLQASLPKIVGL